jgi:phosphoribosyl 1,2-cyclic phosphodiesterase
MRLQVLSSGSGGNATLVRAGETCALIDAGLPLAELEARLGRARVAVDALAHVALSHGHLDHARSAGALARRADATLWCCEALMGNASLRRARRFATLPVGRAVSLAREAAGDALELCTVCIPHDADPTLAFRVEHAGRVAVVLTDLGHPEPALARPLAGAHVLVLEFNHDLELLRQGPYPQALKRRVAGPLGHLSNAEAACMLRALAGPELHTLVLAHLSQTNNTPERALEVALSTLAELGLAHVRVLVASQDEIGESLAV